MVIIVVLINLLISIMLLYVARQIWKLKNLLRIVTDRLNIYERATHILLYTAPESIYTGQQQIYELREKQQNLKLQIAQVQQILNIILLGKKIFTRYNR